MEAAYQEPFGLKARSVGERVASYLAVYIYHFQKL